MPTLHIALNNGDDIVQVSADTIGAGSFIDISLDNLRTIAQGDDSIALTPVGKSSGLIKKMLVVTFGLTIVNPAATFLIKIKMGNNPTNTIVNQVIKAPAGDIVTFYLLFTPQATNTEHIAHTKKTIKNAQKRIENAQKRIANAQKEIENQLNQL